MARDYQKINTLFMRDENNIIMPDTLTCPEFNYLKNVPWECTEKIDGTNIHIDYLLTADYDADGNVNIGGFEAEFHGRTANAKIPTHLENKLRNLFWPEDEGKFDDFQDGFNSAFDKAMESMRNNRQNELRISLYGEGYGVKIQKGGNYIKNDVGFILFDVRVGDWWLSREACEDIAKKLNIPIVPLIGYMTIPEAIDYVKKGFKSTIAENPDYDAEGLVLKTPYGLQFRNGQRIITKIKTCDFQKYRNKYGDGPVAQTPNPNYKK